MAVAFDAFTSSSAWTTSSSPFAFNHTPSGTPAAAVVFVFQTAGTTQGVTAVTYGGQAMQLLRIAKDTAGEPGWCYCFYLYDPPTGVQSVSITHNAAAEAKWACAITVTAGTAGAWVIADGILEENAANPQIFVDSGATSALRLWGIYSGLPNVTDLTLVAGSSTVADRDVGVRIARVDRETTASAGNVRTGYTAASDDVAMISIALAESVAQEVTPPPVELTLDGVAVASITVPVDLAPPPVALQLGAPAPAVESPVEVTPPAVALELAGTSATVDAPVEITPTAAQAALGGVGPAVDAPVELTPSAAVAALGGSPAAVDSPSDLAPPPVALELGSPAPAVDSPVELAPPPVALELGGVGPEVGAGVEVTPAPVVTALGGVGPAVDSPVELTPPPMALELGAPAPVVESGSSVAPAPVVLALGGVGPAVDSPVELAPAGVELRLGAPGQEALAGPLATVTAAETRIGRNLLRGTVPCPDDWTEVPLHLEDPLGNPLPTEQYLTLAGPAGNARVLELRAAYLGSPGGSQTFSVVPGAVPSAEGFHADVAATLALEDHNGVTHTLALLTAGASSATPGQVTHRVRIGGELTSGGGARHLGVDAYVMTVAGEADVWLVDMSVQNGNVGTPGAPLGTEILHHLWFEELRLELPAGFQITHQLPNPHTSSTHLITPLGGTALHVLQQGAVHDFRFAIHTAASAARASVLLGHYGAFRCDYSLTAWSWGNPATAWLGPTGTIVPDVNLGAWLPYDRTHQQIADALEDGTPVTIWGNASVPCGPFHPRGPTDGGIPGGTGITGDTGVEFIASGALQHLRNLMAVQMMDKDRQAGVESSAAGDKQPEHGIAICGPDQLPIDAGAWDLSALKFVDIGWLNYNHQGPFPRNQTDESATDAVIAAGRLPWYWSALTAFKPYKFSHLVRGMGASQALVYLYNDPLARTHVGHVEAWSRFLLAEYGNGALAESWINAQAFPGKGGIGGRYHGWPGLYALLGLWLGDPSRRANGAAWASRLRDHDLLAQLPSGNLHADIGGKPSEELLTLFGVVAAAAQAIEIGIRGRTVRSLALYTEDPALRAWFRKACTGLRAYHWKVGTGAPHRIAPVRPYDPNLPAWATQGEAPAAFTTDTDNYQIASLILGGWWYSPQLPAAWSALYAMTGTSTPTAARDAIAAQMPVKGAEGWFGILGWLQAYTAEDVVTPPPVVIQLGQGAASSVDSPVELAPPPVELELTGQAASAGQDVAPAPVVLALGGVAPAVDSPVEVTPSPAAVPIIGQPRATSDHVEVHPDAVVLELGPPAPAVDSPVELAPPPVALELAAVAVIPPDQIAPAPVVILLGALGVWDLQAPGMVDTLTARLLLEADLVAAQRLADTLSARLQLAAELVAAQRLEVALLAAQLFEVELTAGGS